MSRGLGQIEWAILAMIEGEDEERRYAAEELANAIYRPHVCDDGWCCTRSQRVAVIRAMHSLLRKHPDKSCALRREGPRATPDPEHRVR